MSQTISLLYAPGATSYPVITLPPAEVCSGQSYYDMNGALQAGSKNCAAPAVTYCTVDGQPNCMVSGVFTAFNVSGFSPWDLRAGRSIAGVAGALKVNCRNGTATSGGVGDTIDDYNGFAGPRVTTWPSGTFCDGSNWQDLTTPDGGMSFTSCASSSANCQYKDLISNLVVTKTFTSASTWTGARTACNDATYGDFAVGTWRLPTQKELLSLYEHGIVAKNSSEFIPLASMQAPMPSMQAPIWSSSSTTGTGGVSAWAVVLANGKAEPNSKTSSLSFICVK